MVATAIPTGVRTNHGTTAKTKNVCLSASRGLLLRFQAGRDSTEGYGHNSSCPGRTGSPASLRWRGQVTGRCGSLYGGVTRHGPATSGQCPLQGGTGAGWSNGAGCFRKYVVRKSDTRYGRDRYPTGTRELHHSALHQTSLMKHTRNSQENCERRITTIRAPATTI